VLLGALIQWIWDPFQLEALDLDELGRYFEINLLANMVINIYTVSTV
jgi:hypothetical protein